MMHTRIDDWLLANGYSISRPQRRIAVSPRVAAKEFEPLPISGRHLVAVVRALVNRAICAAIGHDTHRSFEPHVVSIWDPVRGEYVRTRHLTRTCRRCERYWISRTGGGKR